MELETLFTEQKWNILKLLSQTKLSPLQMAERSNTTMANISQQLRLLEAAHLVKKEKIQNRDKGKPRSLFSLSNDYAYVVSAMHGFADKKLLELDDFSKIMFRTWFLDKELNYYIAKFLWTIEPHIDNISYIAVQQAADDIMVFLVCDKSLKLKDVAIKGPKYKSKMLKIKIISKGEAKKKTDVQVLYDQLNGAKD